MFILDSINLLKLFDNFAPNSQSDILSAQLLWMNFFTSRWLSYNPIHLLDLKFRISVTASKVLHYNGYSDASEVRFSAYILNICHVVIFDLFRLLYIRNQTAEFNFVLNKCT